jgi:hypothetical protein
MISLARRASLRRSAIVRRGAHAKTFVERTLSEGQGPYNYYLVCGVQGQNPLGKGEQREVSRAGNCFDAAQARARDRAGAVAQARRFSCRLICIWVWCPLELALSRNRGRPSDQVVGDDVVNLVFNTFEPPTLEEGFDEVLKVENGDREEFR